MKFKKSFLFLCAIALILFGLFAVLSRPERVEYAHFQNSFIEDLMSLHKPMVDLLHVYIESSVFGEDAIGGKSIELFEYYNNEFLSTHYFLTSIFYFTNDDIQKAIENSDKSLKNANMSMSYVLAEIYNIFLLSLSEDQLENIKYSANQLIKYDFSRSLTIASISIFLGLNEVSDFPRFNSQDEQYYFEFIVWFRERIENQGYQVDKGVKEFLTSIIDDSVQPESRLREN